MGQKGGQTTGLGVEMLASQLVGDILQCRVNHVLDPGLDTGVRGGARASLLVFAGSWRVESIGVVLRPDCISISQIQEREEISLTISVDESAIHAFEMLGVTGHILQIPFDNLDAHIGELCRPPINQRPLE